MTPDPIWQEIRSQVIQRDRGTCGNCGRTYPLSVHHIWPRSQGGGHHDKNLVTLCCDCHDNICDLCSRKQSLRVPEYDPLASHTPQRKKKVRQQWPRPRAYVQGWV
jgi:hypothetical protein